MRQISFSKLASDVIFHTADVTEAQALPWRHHVGRDEVGEGEQQAAHPHQVHPHADQQRLAGAFPDQGDQREGGDEAEVVRGGDVSRVRGTETESVRGLGFSKISEVFILVTWKKKGV